MKLEQIDTSKFLFDPKKDNFEELLIKESPVFNFTIDKVNRKKALTYIALMYDPNSEIRKTKQNFNNRKYEAGVTAGFNLNNQGRFHEIIEKLLLGGYKKFNEAVIKYASLCNEVNMLYLCVLDLNVYKNSVAALESYDKNADQLLENMISKRAEIERGILGGEDTNEIRKELYKSAQNIIDELRPEGVINKMKETGLKGWSPYEEGYIPDDISFVGEKEPKE